MEEKTLRHCPHCNVVVYTPTDLEVHIQARHTRGEIRNGQSTIDITVEIEGKLFPAEETAGVCWCKKCNKHFLSFVSLSEHIHFRHFLSYEEKLTRRRYLRSERLKNVIHCNKANCQQRFHSEEAFRIHQLQGCRKFRPKKTQEELSYEYTKRRLHRENIKRSEAMKRAYVQGTGCDLCRETLVPQFTSKFQTKQRHQYHDILRNAIEEHYKLFHPNADDAKVVPIQNDLKY